MNHAEHPFYNNANDNYITLQTTIDNSQTNDSSARISKEADHYVLSGQTGIIFNLSSYYSISDTQCVASHNSWVFQTNSKLQHSQAAILFSKPSGHFPNRYNGYEIIYVLSGILKEEMHNAIIPLTEDELLITNPNVIHNDIFVEDTEILSLRIPVSQIKLILKNSILADSVHHFFEPGLSANASQIEYYHYAPAHSKELRSILEQIIDEATSSLPGSELIVNGLLSRFLSILSSEKKLQNHMSSESHQNSFSIFLQIERFLEKEYWNTTEAALSQIFHYSNQYLNQIIKQYTGLSIHKYCVEKKLSLASHLLQSSEMPVQQIIQFLGYENKTYFYRIFREKYGMTPQQLRDSKQ